MNEIYVFVKILSQGRRKEGGRIVIVSSLTVQCTEVRNALYFPVGIWQVPVDNSLGSQKIKNTTVYSITEEKIAAL